MMRSTAFSILLLFGFLPCSALDPAKALTQYGHDPQGFNPGWGRDAPPNPQG
jgi:hypothetical protein